jgi:ubiquinone/menaquinone biosynthesis C-methylase UbiE
MNSISNWELFTKALSLSPGDRILDVGAGKGKVAGRLLAESGDVELYALEPDEKRVEYIRRKAPRVKGYLGSSEKMPFDDSFFDKAYTTMAAHHFRDVDLALREFARVLKKGGRLVVLDVNPSGGTGRLAAFFENTIMRRRLRFLRPDEMENRLRATGRLAISYSTLKASGYLVACVVVN